MHAVYTVHAQSLLSISYIVLALPLTVTKLSNKTLIFHYFQGPTINFYDFPGLENEMLKVHDFQVFHDMYKPCHMEWKFQGGGGSKAKVPSVWKNPLPISLLNYYSLKIKFVLAITRGLNSVKLPILKTVDCWGIRYLLWQYQPSLSSVNKSESSWHNHYHGQSKHHK